MPSDNEDVDKSWKEGDVKSQVSSSSEEPKSPTSDETVFHFSPQMLAASEPPNLIKLHFSPQMAAASGPPNQTEQNSDNFVPKEKYLQGGAANYDGGQSPPAIAEATLNSILQQDITFGALSPLPSS